MSSWVTTKINTEITKSSVPLNSAQSNGWSIQGGEVNAVFCVLTGLIIPSLDMNKPCSVYFSSLQRVQDSNSSVPDHALSSLTVMQTEGVVMGNDDGASQRASTGGQLKQSALLNARDVWRGDTGRRPEGYQSWSNCFLSCQVFKQSLVPLCPLLKPSHLHSAGRCMLMTPEGFILKFPAQSCLCLHWGSYLSLSSETWEEICPKS